MPEKLKCEIGVACEGKPEDEIVVIQEAQIAGDFWVPVCTECAEILTYIRNRELSKTSGNGGSDHAEEDRGEEVDGG